MIGLFDSGIGGLSVLRAIRAASPSADLLYVADRARAPYGSRGLGAVRAMSHEIADWLIERGADPIVIACNTASAAALSTLRRTRPAIRFVGMEPAVKPAAASTTTGVVGVLATETTFQGRLFQSVVSRHAADTRVIARACPSWVSLVERGELSGPQVETVVGEVVESLLAEGADLLVVACTHFSFLVPVITAMAGPGVRVVDPAQAVADQALRVAGDTGGQGILTLAASGDLAEFAHLAVTVGGVKGDGPVLPFPS